MLKENSGRSFRNEIFKYQVIGIDFEINRDYFWIIQQDEFVIVN